MVEEDEAWEPLPLDRDDPELKKAIELSEQAIEAIEQNNGYASTAPEERNGILAVLKGNIQALKEGSLPKRILVTGLVNPFKYITRKFGDSLIGQLAGAAAKALAAYFGISI